MELRTHFHILFGRCGGPARHLRGRGYEEERECLSIMAQCVADRGKKDEELPYRSDVRGEVLARALGLIVYIVGGYGFTLTSMHLLLSLMSSTEQYAVDGDWVLWL